MTVQILLVKVPQAVMPKPMPRKIESDLWLYNCLVKNNSVDVLTLEYYNRNIMQL